MRRSAQRCAAQILVRLLWHVCSHSAMQMSNFNVFGQVDELRGSPMSVGSLEEIIDEKYVSLVCSWCR
jgi:hypothetical protein